MMRQPTPRDVMYELHTRALETRTYTPWDINEPACGWYLTQMVREGPLLPARIWLEQKIDPETGELEEPEELRCEIAGQPRNPEKAWMWLAKRPITEAEYHRRMTMLNDAPFRATHAKVAMTETPMRPR